MSVPDSLSNFLLLNANIANGEPEHKRARSMNEMRNDDPPPEAFRSGATSGGGIVRGELSVAPQHQGARQRRVHLAHPGDGNQKFGRSMRATTMFLPYSMSPPGTMLGDSAIVSA